MWKWFRWVLLGLLVLVIGIGVALYYQQKNPTSVQQTQTNNQAITKSYPIVDTNQGKCFDNEMEIACPSKNEAFYGQDAQYKGLQPIYKDNGNGTITDLNTNLVWQKDPGEKITYPEAQEKVKDFSLAGKNDWRIPTIKELYSLIEFNGTDPSENSTASELTPFINTEYFDFQYGKEADGDRVIDSQWVTDTIYKSTVMNNQQCFFGVNFADGRIKCYPTSTNKKYYAIFVRGNSDYGKNSLTENGQTISDKATGLMWQKNDSAEGMVWESALKYCQEQTTGSFNDWRLPNAKELQSIVDYSRSPDTSNSAAIDPMFQISTIQNEKNEKDYPYFWTNTTHVRLPDNGSQAVYISFGRAIGKMNEIWMDVHGAGAQRSDPKNGVPENQKNGFGPQGDARRSYNYVRCVRDL